MKSTAVRFSVALLVTLLVICLIAGVYLHVSGFGKLLHNRWVQKNSAPTQPFDPAVAAARPDYAIADNWAALPEKSDPADLVPKGLEDSVVQGTAPVDVFFIHPTGFLSGASWTSPMDSQSAAEENTHWMMAYQASAFNGCCNVYAPRYREASIYSYFADTLETRDRVLAFAYEDVERAFEYFIKHHNDGRPFIVASHSQGSHHAKRLLKDKLDASPLRERMVAAYIIGSVGIGVRPEWLQSLENISVCESAIQLNCLVHWDTMAENGAGIGNVGESLCVNPLSWERASGRVAAERHLGAVPVRDEFLLDFGYDNSPTHRRITSLDAIISRLTWAECLGGKLVVARLQADDFAGLNKLGNYHILDYSLFYLDIRENAKLRVKTYLQRIADNQE